MDAEFEAHLESCSRTVARWPKWKQGVLGLPVRNDSNASVIITVRNARARRVGEMVADTALIDPDREDWYRKLKEPYSEASHNGWDGFGGRAVSEATFQLTANFMAHLPPDVGGFEIGAEPGGSLTLEWRRDPKHILSVDVNAKEPLAYAMLDGEIRQTGSGPALDMVGIVAGIAKRTMHG